MEKWKQNEDEHLYCDINKMLAEWREEEIKKENNK